MNNEDLLRDYLDGVLADEVNGVAPSPADSEQPLDLASRLERAERCENLLTRAWGERSASETCPKGSLQTPLQPLAEQRPVELEQLGHFTIRRVLGRGGMGTVFLAHDQSVDREVALKVPHAGLLIHSQAKQRFLREARVAGRLEHPNLASIYEAGEVGPICFIASAYCPGPTLGQWMRDTSQPIDQRLAASLVATLADAMQHAHDRGVLHRDLKPGNVLLNPVDESPVNDNAIPDFPYAPLITDFGLAESEDENSITTTGVPIGTAKYMSPEQASGERELVGPPTDIYALGVILYELLCGVAPFAKPTMAATLVSVHRDDPTPLRRHRSSLPVDLEAICLKCLAKDPSDRYHSAAELRDDLRRQLAGLPTFARPLPISSRLVRWAARSPAAAGLAIVSGLAILGLVVGLSFYSRAITRHAREVGAALEQARQEHIKTAMALEAAKTARHRANQEKRVAEQQRQRALASELRARRMTYLSDMQRAFERRELNQLNDIAVLLERHVPPPGEGDLRGLEWSVLRREVKPLHLLGNHDGPATECVLLPGNRVATAGEDGLIKIWDVSQRSLQATFEPKIGPIYAMAVSPDGQTLAIGGQPSLQTFDLARIYLLNAATGERKGALQRHHTTIESIAFFPDGERIAAGSRYSKVELSKLDGTSLFSFPTTERSESVVFSANGRFLAFTVKKNDDTHVRIVEVASGEVKADFPCTRARQMSWLPQGERIAAMQGWSPDLEVFGLDRPAEPWRRLATSAPQPQELSCIAIANNSATLVAGDVEGNLHWWRVPDADRQNGTELIEVTSTDRMQVHSDRITALTVAEHDNLVFTASDGTVKLLGSSAGHQHFHSSDVAIESAYLVNDNTLYLGCSDGSVRRHGLGESADASRFHAGNEPVLDLAISLDLTVLVTVSNSGRIDVREPDSGCVVWSPIIKPQGYAGEDPRMNVALSGDGRTLAATGTDNVLHVWDIPRRQEIFSHPLTCDGNTVALSPDGTRLACGSDRVHLFDIATEALIYESVGGNEVYALQFAPDGELLASGHLDGSVRILNVQSPTQPRILRGHQADLDAVAFSADGRSLVSCDELDMIRIWDVETGEAYGTLGLQLPAASQITDRRLVASRSHLVALLVGDGPAAGLHRWELEPMRGEHAVCRNDGDTLCRRSQSMSDAGFKHN